MKAVCPKSLWNKDGKDYKPFQPNSVLVHLVLVSVQVCFSGWHVLAKIALNDGVNAVALAMAREVCATILMFIIARRVDGVVTLDPAHAMRFVWMGLASFGNVVGAILALAHFSPMAFGMMQPSIPVLAMILSYMCGVEQMSQLKCVGVLISVAGALWVEFYSATSAADATVSGVAGGLGMDGGAAGEGIGDANASDGRGPWLGSLILFWQCASMATLMVLQKPVMAVYPSATVTAWYYAVGSAFTVLLCMCYGVQPSDFLFSGQWEPWVALLYVVLFGTVYTYNAYSWVLNIVSPTTATVYLTLQPVATVILSVVFLSAVVKVADIFGGVIVVIGLLVTVYAKGLERRGTNDLIRAKQNRELTRAFKTPGRHRFRRSVGIGGGASGDLSNSDTDGVGLGVDSDQDPLLGGVAGGGEGEL